jgi:hypothetical protein
MLRKGEEDREIGSEGERVFLVVLVNFGIG